MFCYIINKTTKKLLRAQCSESEFDSATEERICGGPPSSMWDFPPVDLLDSYWNGTKFQADPV